MDTESKLARKQKRYLSRRGKVDSTLSSRQADDVVQYADFKEEDYENPFAAKRSLLRTRSQMQTEESEP